MKKIIKILPFIFVIILNIFAQIVHYELAIFSVLHCYDRIDTIRKRINSSLIKSRFKADELINRSKVILVDQRGEGTISQAISILTATVLGSLLLLGLYKLIESTVLPELQKRIMEMFNYSS